MVKGKGTEKGAKPWVYIAKGNGLIRAKATDVYFGEKTAKGPNSKWVCCLNSQTLVADKTKLHSKKAVQKAQKSAKAILKEFKAIEAAKEASMQKIRDAKEKAPDMKASSSMKKAPAMKKKK